MARQLRHVRWIIALLALVATPVAGCSAGIGGGETPDAGPPDPGTTGGGGGGGGGSACGTDPCDLYRQCGCAAGQACTLDPGNYDTAGTQCREITDNGQSNANCSRAEECAAGYDCLGSPGQCRRYCKSDGECGPGAHCLYQIVYDDGSGTSQDVPSTKACTKACKPESTAGLGCPQDPQMACRYYYSDPNGTPDSGDEFYYTDCTAAGAGGDKASCEANGDSDCKPGYGCFTIIYCTPDANGDCTPGTETNKNECRQICVWSVGGKDGARTCDTDGTTCHEDAGQAAVGDIAYGICF